MMRLKIKVKIIAAIMAVVLLLSGCWSSHEVNTLGISVCLGIDKSEKGYLVSEQMINPKAVAAKKSTNEAPVVVWSLEGSNIPEIITRMTTLTSRKIYSSHLRMVILGEDIARDGIADIVDYMMRYHEYRTDFSFAIAKGSSAKEILDVLTPIEAIPGVDIFNKLQMSHKEWAPTRAVKIIELANDLSTEGISPTMTAIEKVDGDKETDSTDVLRNSNNYEKLRISDIGIFKEDKLVGWLNEEESKGYSYIVNNVTHTVGYNANTQGVEISAEVLKANSKIKPYLDNDKPEIDVTVKLKYVITAVKGNIDVSKIDSLEVVNQLSEDKITRMCAQSVQKAQSEKTDIFGFGEQIHDRYPEYWGTVKDHWSDIFASIPVNIHVTAEMVSTGDLTKKIVSTN